MTPVAPRRGLGHTAPLRYVDAVGLWCALGYAALAVLARQSGEPPLPCLLPPGRLDRTAGLRALPVFPPPRRAVPRSAVCSSGQVVFRLCGLVGGPFFEDDFYRYLWDGYRFAATGTPYGAAPEAFFVDPGVPAAFQSVLNGINYPELPTIYAPVTQFIFLLGYWLQPGSVTVLQAILIAFDLATVGLLLRLAPARNVMLYAWCPLVVKEIAFTAHPDGAGACLLLAAIVLARDRRWRVAAVCLGLAAGAKAFGLGTGAARAGPRRASGTGSCSAPRWPRCMHRSCCLAEPISHPWASLQESGNSTPRSSACCRPPCRRSRQGSSWASHSRCSGGATMSGTPGAARGGFRGATGFTVRCSAASPVINPWYLLWLLPFAAVSPGIWAWTASVAVLLSYVTGLNLQDYEMHPYAQPLWARGLGVRPDSGGLRL